MWIALVTLTVIGWFLVHSLYSEVKKLQSQINKMGAEFREAIDALEGLKPGDRQALDTVHNVIFRERLCGAVKEAGAESLLS